MFVNDLFGSDTFAHDFLADHNNHILGCSELSISQYPLWWAFLIYRWGLQTHSQQESVTVDTVLCVLIPLAPHRQLVSLVDCQLYVQLG